MNLRTRRQTTALAVLLALCLAAGGCVAETSDAGTSQAEVAARIESGSAPLLLDVRTPEEYARDHVPGAVNIPHDQLASRVSEIDVHRDREVVVYCERGGRAAKASEILEASGFSTIRHLDGDMSAWREAGLPTE